MVNLSLYDKDFYAWTEEQIKILKENNLSNLDIIHLQEELQFMGAREKSELKNRLAMLLMQLEVTH